MVSPTFEKPVTAGTVVFTTVIAGELVAGSVRLDGGDVKGVVEVPDVAVAVLVKEPASMSACVTT